MDLETTVLTPVTPPRSSFVEEPSHPKGIEPQLLLKQVYNTAPFLRFDVPDQSQAHRYLKVLNEIPSDASWERFTWSQYYELCVAAHFATVATFVPTDVDVHIRFKLWDPSLEDEELLAMIDTVIGAYTWDTSSLSSRWVQSPTGQLLEGHKGEWFSIAAAAYGISRFRFPQKSKEVLGLIYEEISKEESVLEEFLQEKDWLNGLRASVLIAHNLGDLVRVLEMWGVPTLLGERLNTPVLEKAGLLNRDLMAVENSRHFALREPRALRKSRDFLLPLGPFFDDWGKKLATHPDLHLEELGTVAEALIQGWVRLKGPVGYSRALAGLETHTRGGIRNLLKALPSRVAKTWTSGALRQLCDMPQPRFEAQWARKCENILAS